MGGTAHDLGQIPKAIEAMVPSHMEEKLRSLAAWCRQKGHTTKHRELADALRRMADASEKWAAEVSANKRKEK